MIDLFAWGTPVEVERRRRIQLSLWAYAYEIKDTLLVDDHIFDAVARQSDITIRTGRLDEWWAKNFHPDTGVWIHDHPELDRLAARYSTLSSSLKASVAG